jgi:hypothetical protein
MLFTTQQEERLIDNRKNDLSLWDTVAHRRGTNKQTNAHTTQQEERPVTMGYTSAYTGSKQTKAHTTQ